MFEISKMKILLAMREGAKFFTEIEKMSRVSSATLGKHLRDLEREGLITITLNRLGGRVRPAYELNKAKMNEINKLINEYIEHKKREFKEMIDFALKYFNEKDFFEIVELLKKRLESGNHV